MSSQDTTAIQVGQVYSYVTCAMSSLVLYRIVLNMDQEVEFIWNQGSSKRTKLLYLILCYGGLLEAIMFLLSFLDNVAPYTCVVTLALGQGVVPLALVFGLNAMMAMRVYAIWDRSRQVLIALAVLFAITQAFSIATFIGLMVAIKITVSQGDSACDSAFPAALNWIELASNFVTCTYEIILLAMVLYRVIAHRKYGYGRSFWSFNTLLAIMTRDHVFYFLLASLNWTAQAVSYLPNFPVKLESNLAWTVFLNAVVIFSLCMIGPIMLLSIRRFDAVKHQKPATASADLETVVFTAGVAYSRGLMAQETGEI